MENKLSGNIGIKVQKLFKWNNQNNQDGDLSFDLKLSPLFK